MFSRLRVYLLELTFSWQGSSFRYWNYPNLIIFHMFSLWFSISVYRLGPVCSDSVNSLIGTLSFGSPELTWFLRLVISWYQVFMILWSISANTLRVFISFCLYRDSFLVTSATLRTRSSARTSSSSATFCIAFVFDSDFWCFVTTFGFYILLSGVVFNFIIFRCWRTFRILLLMMIVPTNLLLLMLMWLIMLVLMVILRMVILMTNIFRLMMFFVMRMRLYRFPPSPGQFFVIVAFGFLLVVGLRFGSYAVSLAVNVFNGFLSNSIPCV